MNATLRTTVLACLLGLAFARAAAAPLAGKWEGSIDGRKAVSLELQDTPVWKGSIVFYILRDHGGGNQDGEAAAPLPLVHLEWNGRALRFQVEAGDRLVSFELRSGGEGTASLQRFADAGNPSVTIALSAIR
jgi:hypothetical protein